MRRRLARALRWLTAACFVVTGAREAAAENPADIAAARELFQEGTTAAEAGRWPEAADRFSRSLALKQAPLTVYSLGVAQRKTGKLAWALENFRAFLSEPATAVTEPYRDPAREAVVELEKRVAYVSFILEPPELPGLTITLDGERVPLVVLDRPRLLDPGAHRVEAQAPERDPTLVDFHVTEGEKASVRLELPRTTSIDPSPWLGGGLMIVGGGAVVVGVSIGLAGVNEAAAAPTRDGPEANAARSKAVAGDVTAGVGVALAATGLIVLLSDMTSDDKEPPATVSRSYELRPWGRGPVTGLELRF